MYMYVAYTHGKQSITDKRAPPNNAHEQLNGTLSHFTAK